MENFDPKGYRKDLANDLNTIRKIDRPAAEAVLEGLQNDREYQTARAHSILSRKNSPKDLEFFNKTIQMIRNGNLEELSKFEESSYYSEVYNSFRNPKNKIFNDYNKAELIDAASQGISKIFQWGIYRDINGKEMVLKSLKTIFGFVPGMREKLSTLPGYEKMLNELVKIGLNYSKSMKGNNLSKLDRDTAEVFRDYIKLFPELIEKISIADPSALSNITRTI